MPVRARPFTTLFSLLLAACGSGGDRRFDVLLVGDPDTVAGDARPLSAASGLIREATRSGFVSIDDEGRIRPELAARWIVTDDGLSYIFRFEPREVDGEPPLTAGKVRKALNAAIARTKGTGLGLDLTVIDGIYARTDEVIEIRLKTAMPEFMQLLAAPELALDFTDATTDALVLETEGSLLTLSRPVPDEVNGEGATLDIRVAPAKEAVERFQAGQAELLLGGDIDALPHVEMGGLLRGTIRLDPVTGIFGLAVSPRGEGDFLSRASNREAVSMAIDRQALIAPFNIGGWVPRTRLVPVGMPGTQQPPGRWDGLEIGQRQAFAAQRVAGWLASEGTIDPITIALPPGTGGDILFRRLSADLGRIGLATKRVGWADKAQLRLVDEVASFDRPEWYLHRFDCTVLRGACNSDADALVAQAIAEPATARRNELLAEAERILTEENGFISFGPPIRFSLVRGGIDGFAINRWGFHPLSQLIGDPN
ncbi:ABC transporter substrate-binding protein [Croceicoccus bisphenolivorans]|uniref:ABC transporter substrate-binding protein n=1 Tax=Croceicoccus bisphenolivorans TaxID=1783232 RepID=UPI000836A351|nr:hypothetical protein [Croceicoccus bisphenolivorans]